MGSNDVSVRGRLVSNAVTHPMAVLATGAAGPFESRRSPADSGHVALSFEPFTVGHRAVGRWRRFLLGPPSGVGTAVEWPPETKIRRQRFWRRTGVLLLLVAVDVMVASTARQHCCIPRPLPLDLPPPPLGPPYPPRLVWHPPLATSACGLGVTADADRCSSWRVLRVVQEARTICSTSWRRRKGESSRDRFSIS